MILVIFSYRICEYGRNKCISIVIIISKILINPALNDTL